ncbi:flagellar motor switch phosphatase FliY [Alicyclobacillus tolerans]|uniref:flagellar motor switch phosphatase FliY n=1 Tax=Alicyclobacillus tolerans TaxID=90970 RepID=UPI001F030891|nr:flagellar motor switch phosphatase FliY [Alicyclobacillus tolerans]MCF8564764.1 flagellar motor switch phosphatase FliY [Alicyclobacillus tolerans]
MNGDSKLTQAEIDALLGGTASHAAAPGGDGVDPVLTDLEKDALGEIGNISFGSAATSLSTLLQQRVEITTPTVTLLRREEVHNQFPRPYVLVSVQFTEGLSGVNALAIELQDAKTIADLMMGGSGEGVAGELNELHLSAVGEAMNQMMGSAATSMSSMFSRTINISPPDVKVVDFAAGHPGEFGSAQWLVNVSFRLKIGRLVDSKIMQLIAFDFAKEMVRVLSQSADGGSDLGQYNAGEHGSARTVAAEMATSSAPYANSQPAVPSTAQVSTASGPELLRAEPGYGEPVEMRPAPAMAMAPASVQQQGMAAVASTAVVQRPEFPDFSSPPRETAKEPRNLSLLMDVPLTVTVELGRTKKPIRDILELAAGAVLELDKLAGEPVDIFVNNKRIAIGEVVVIDENFGVRVTDIVSPIERVKNLQ